MLAERARMLQQEVRNTINRAPKSLQGVLTGVQQRITDARLRARLEASRDAKVDVQVGLELYEGIPQEWRSRLWTALLQHPSCASGFGEITVRCCWLGTAFRCCWLGTVFRCCCLGTAFRCCWLGTVFGAQFVCVW